MKKIYCFFVIVCLFFGSCGDAPEGEDSYHEQIVVYSIDSYDGLLLEGYGHNMVNFDEQPKITANHGAMSFTTAFFTFELPADIDLAEHASLKLYVTDFADYCADSPGQDPHLYLSIRPWETKEKDYQLWQNCDYYHFGSNGPFYEPPGCSIVPHLDWSIPMFEMRSMSGQSNQGWYVLDSPRFQDFIRSLPDRQVGDRIYFSFEVNTEITGDLTACLAYPSFMVIFEDGGNHGGTGNLPRLEIIY